MEEIKFDHTAQGFAESMGINKDEAFGMRVHLLKTLANPEMLYGGYPESRLMDEMLARFKGIPQSHYAAYLIGVVRVFPAMGGTEPSVEDAEFYARVQSIPRVCRQCGSEDVIGLTWMGLNGESKQDRIWLEFVCNDCGSTEVPLERGGTPGPENG